MLGTAEVSECETCLILKLDVVELVRRDKSQKSEQGGLQGSERSSEGSVPLARPERMDKIWVEGKHLVRRLR